MKKSLLLLLLATSSGVSLACEICGCANNNFQIGLLPNFKKYFVGLRYSSAHYNSHLASDPTQFSTDYYKSFELWGGYQFKKIQVMAFLPYLRSTKISDDGQVDFNGLGDAILMANYKTWSKMSMNESMTRTTKNELWLGGGIKLPTGASRVDVTQSDVNMGDYNSLPGTGSVDYLLNVTHNLLWNDRGIVTNATYRVNTANAQNYRFGNRIYVSSSFFQTFTIKNVKIRPMIGINYLQNSMNTYDGGKISGSDGHSFSGIAGVNLIFRKFGIITNTYVPITQKMNDGQTKLQSKTTLGLTFSI
jgi:hypothetical protein